MDQKKEWAIEEPESEAQSGLDEKKNLGGAENAGAGDQEKKPSMPSSDSDEKGSAPEPVSSPRTAPQGEEEEIQAAGEAPEQKPGNEGETPEQVQKRIKRATRKELLELIHRKNAMLLHLDKEVRKAKQDLSIKEDRLLRLAAEFENYKKRTRREWELLQKRANADLIKEIIGGIDNFDRAFENLGGVDSQLHDGIRLIHAGLMDVLRRVGLKEMEALNQKFDPLYHEAVGEIESEGLEEGYVAHVVQKGYLLNNQVLRPARVMVSKKKG